MDRSETAESTAGNIITTYHNYPFRRWHPPRDRILVQGPFQPPPANQAAVLRGSINPTSGLAISRPHTENSLPLGGVPTRSIIVGWGIYWAPIFSENYHMYIGSFPIYICIRTSKPACFEACPRLASKEIQKTHLQAQERQCPQGAFAAWSQKGQNWGPFREPSEKWELQRTLGFLHSILREYVLRSFCKLRCHDESQRATLSGNLRLL